MESQTKQINPNKNPFLIIAIIIGVIAISVVGFVNWKYFGSTLIENDLTNAVKFEEDKNKPAVKKIQEQKVISKSTIKSIDSTNRKENGEANYLECSSEENPPAVYYGKGGNVLECPALFIVRLDKSN